MGQTRFLPEGTRARHVLEYAVVRVLICILQILPMEACAALAKWMAWLANDILKLRRKVTQENLSAVFPEKSAAWRDQISRRMWEHLILMVCEIAQAPRMLHEASWRQYVHVRDKRMMTAYFLDGRPLVIVSGHFGNFEIASYVAGALGLTTHAIAKPIGNPLIDRFVQRFRRSRGQEMLPYVGSTKQVEQVLHDRGILLLLGDQHAGSRGCWVDFFGRPASCHKALALFTLTQKAPMMVTYTVRTGRPFHFEIGCVGVAEPNHLSDEQSTVRGLTQWYNRRLESAVRVMPEQYWWLHKRWKERLPRTRKRAA